MDQIRQQDQSDEKKINDRKCEKFLKRSLKFVISVSVLNFIVWYSSGFCIQPQSFNAYFSTSVLLSSMLTPSLQRKYMFLICNAILAFLLLPNTSPFSSPPASDIVDQFHASPMDVEQVEKQEEHYEEEELSQGSQNVETASSTPEEEEEEEVEGKDEEAGRIESGVVMDTTTVANQEFGIINTEELNRKFEEFIRKMKEEIRIEAQTHPIAV